MDGGFPAGAGLVVGREVAEERAAGLGVSTGDDQAQTVAGDLESPEDARRRFTGVTPRELLTELAALVTEIAGRAAGGWTLYRDAAAVDPDIAADRQELQMLRQRLISRILGDIPESALAKASRLWVPSTRHG